MGSIYIPTFSEIQAVAQSRGADSCAPGLWKDLVGFWPLAAGGGATAYDISGYGNHGTLTNMDPSSDWVVTEKGRAVNFDKTNNYISVPLNVGTAAGAIGILFKPRSPWYYYNSVFDNSVNLNHWEIWIDATGNLRGRIKSGDTTVSYDLDNLDGPDHWYHIVFAWGANLKLYVNGVLRDSENYTVQAAGSTFYWGGGNAGNTAADGL